MNNLVILESPFAGDIEKNIEYARKCMRDCFMRGEFPFASHLLYTQEGILDDDNPEERKLGIKAGLDWGKCSNKTVVYTDLGMSEGMKEGIQLAEDFGREVEFRSLKIKVVKDKAIRTYHKDVRVWRRNIVKELPSGAGEVTWHDGSKGTYESFEVAVREVQKD